MQVAHNFTRYYQKRRACFKLARPKRCGLSGIVCWTSLTKVGRLGSIPTAGSYRRLEKLYLQPVLSPQCSIHCKNSHVDQEGGRHRHSWQYVRNTEFNYKQNICRSVLQMWEAKKDKILYSVCFCVFFKWCVSCAYRLGACLYNMVRSLRKYFQIWRFSQRSWWLGRTESRELCQATTLSTYDELHRVCWLRIIDVDLVSFDKLNNAVGENKNLQF